MTTPRTWPAVLAYARDLSPVLKRIHGVRLNDAGQVRSRMGFAPSLLLCEMLQPSPGRVLTPADNVESAHRLRMLGMPEDVIGMLWVAEDVHPGAGSGERTPEEVTALREAWLGAWT